MDQSENAASTPAPEPGDGSKADPPPAQVQPSGNPDEADSDLEDLDDVLDDFSKPKQPTQETPPQQRQQQQDQSATQETDVTQKATDDEPQAFQVNEDEMLKQLEASMGELMKGGGEAPTENSSVPDDNWMALADELSKNGMQPAELMKMMLGEDVAGAAGAEGNKTGASAVNTEAAAGSSSGGENFQDTIQKTMERIQQSGDKATAAASEGQGDDMLMQVLKAMESSGMGGGGGGAASGEGGDENLDQIFMGLMQQLSNKEMLYEPMKELHEKFGPWLEENRDKVSAEDRERFELQATLVKEIVNKFDEEGFTDENPEHRAYIWERMQKMQDAGSPPDDLVSNPFGDESKLQEAMGGDAGCPQQ